MNQYAQIEAPKRVTTSDGIEAGLEEAGSHIRGLLDRLQSLADRLGCPQIPVSIEKNVAVGVAASSGFQQRVLESLGRLHRSIEEARDQVNRLEDFV